MADEPKPVRIIPRENSVFRLDRHGNWRVDDEKFRHPRIINHFHSLIKKDQGGFFLEQEHRHYIEKVYFPFEDTALFVTRVIEDEGLTLCLNTGAQMRLAPENLFVRGDDLYLKSDDDIVKFNENALVALAGYLEDVNGQYAIRIDGKTYVIPQRP